MNESSRDILHTLHRTQPAQVTDEMVQSDALHRVIQAYIDNPATDTRQAAHHLTYFLRTYRYIAPLIYKELRTPYSIDQVAAVDAIRRAANSLSSNNPNYAEVVSGNREQLEQLRQQDPTIMDLSRPENIQKLAKVDLLSHALESIADAVESLPEDQVTPGVMRNTSMDYLDLDPDNLKDAGGAYDRDGAMRGFIVRELDQLVPADIVHRYSTIRHLARLAGVSMDKSYPRSLLLKGKT